MRRQKQNLKWVIVVAFLLLVGCGQESVTVHASAPAPHINCAVLGDHRQSMSDHMNAALSDAQGMDYKAAESDLRVAASEMRSMGDAMEATNPGAATHFHRAADTVESSATAIGQYQIDDATSYLTEGVNEVNEGLKALGGACGFSSSIG